MYTIQDFINTYKISMSCTQVDNNPHMDNFNGDHWLCKLRHEGKIMRVYFSQGYGHNGRKPDLESVLDCLASDSVSVENARNFEDWADDLGFDTDSRKADKTYNFCRMLATRLKKLLGEEKYETLLYHTERM